MFIASFIFFNCQTRGVKLVDANDLFMVHGISPEKDEIMGWTKITTGVYTTPKGRMIDGEGIIPDIQVDDPVIPANIDIKCHMEIPGGQMVLCRRSVELHNTEGVK